STTSASTPSIIRGPPLPPSPWIPATLDSALPPHAESMRVRLLRSLLQRVRDPDNRHQRAAESAVRHLYDAQPRRTADGVVGIAAQRYRAAQRHGQPASGG